MKLRSTRRGPGLVVLCIALPLLLGAETADDAPALDRVHQNMNRIRSFMGNAQAKLLNGIQGMETGRGNETPTPVRLCCSSNLSKIRGGIEGLDRAFIELSDCYTATDDSTSALTVEMSKQNLDQFGVGLEQFEQAPELSGALGALGGMTRLYLQIEREVEPLQACPAGKSRGKSKSPSRKKKKKSAESDRKSGSVPGE